MPMQQLTFEQEAAQLGYYQRANNPFADGMYIRQRQQQRDALEKQLEAEGRQLPEGYMDAPTHVYGRYTGSGGVNLSEKGGPGRALVGTVSQPQTGRYIGYFRDVPIYADMVAAPPIPPQAPVIKEEVERPTAELSEEAKAYRTQAEERISAAEKIIAGLQDEEAKAQRAADLQRRMAINAARGQQAASLKIAPASGTSRMAGTQGFKRRSAAAGPVNPYEQVNV